MMTIEELEKLMQEHGLVIRAIPKKVRMVCHPADQNNYPDGRVRYLEEYGRPMLVRESVPENAGKFLIESARTTDPSIHFQGTCFDTLEDALNAVTGIGTEAYFDTFFHLITKKEAKKAWDHGDRSFLVLAPDGSDRYADCFDSWDAIENTYPDAYFGYEKDQSIVRTAALITVWDDGHSYTRGCEVNVKTKEVLDLISTFIGSDGPYQEVLLLDGKRYPVSKTEVLDHSTYWHVPREEESHDRS